MHFLKEKHLNEEYTAVLSSVFGVKWTFDNKN